MLFPLLYLVLIFGQGYIADKTKEHFKIAVIDKSKLFTKEKVAQENIADTNNILSLITSNEAEVIKNFDTLGYNGYVVIPQNFDWKKGIDSLAINTKKTYGFSAVGPLEKKLNNIWSSIKNDSLGIGITQKEILAKEINVKFNKLLEGKKALFC